MAKPSQGRFDGVFGMQTFSAQELFAWSAKYEQRMRDPENGDDPKWLLRRAERLRRVAECKERARESKERARRAR